MGHLGHTTNSFLEEMKRAPGGADASREVEGKRRRFAPSLGTESRSNKEWDSSLSTTTTTTPINENAKPVQGVDVLTSVVGDAKRIQFAPQQLELNENTKPVWSVVKGKDREVSKPPPKFAPKVSKISSGNEDNRQAGPLDLTIKPRKVLKSDSGIFSQSLAPLPLNTGDSSTADTMESLMLRPCWSATSGKQLLVPSELCDSLL